VKTILQLFGLALVAAVPARLFAHSGGDTIGGFASGFTHPIYGPDHVIAMVAVGLWGGQLKKPAIWLLPVTFPVVMAFGGMLGVRGVNIPAVEIGIAASGIVLGVLGAANARPPLWVAAVVVGFFAIFHGHAHGTELPHAATPIAYGAGFVISTGLLHAGGIVFGLLVEKPAGAVVVRIAGGAIAVAGGWFFYGCFA